MNSDLDDQQLDAAISRLHEGNGLQTDPTSSASAALLNTITAGVTGLGVDGTPDMEAPTLVVDVTTIEPKKPHGGRRVLTVAAAFIVLFGVAVGTLVFGSGGRSGVSTENLALDTANNSPGGSPTSTIQSPTPVEEAEQLVVFLRSGATTAELDEIESILTSNDQDFEFVSKEATYDEFVEYYAEDPELLDTISVETMPPSFRIEIGDSVADQQLIERIESRPQVRTVVSSTDSLTAVQHEDTYTGAEESEEPIELVEVPALSGLLIDDAVSIAQDVGLTVQVVTVDEPPATPEHVIRTDPQAGTEIAADSTLILTVQARAAEPVDTEEVALLALEDLVNSRPELFVGYYIDDTGNVVVATSPRETEAQIVLENVLGRTYSTARCSMSGAELAELTTEIQNEMRSMEIAGASAFGTDAKTCTVSVKAALTPAQESQLNQLFGDAITVDPEFSAWRSGATSTTTVGPPAVYPPALECEGRIISSVSPLSGGEGHPTIEDLASFYMREGWSIVDGWAEGREVAVADETGRVIIHLGVNKASDGGWSAGTIVSCVPPPPGLAD